MRNLIIIIILLLGLTGLTVISVNYFYGPVEKNNQEEIFTVLIDSNNSDILDKLSEGKFIKNPEAFNFLFNIVLKDKVVNAGGYKLNKNMYAWQVLQKFIEGPDLIWVVIPEGLRKEQIGEMLGEKLKWTDDELTKWTDEYTTEPDYIEGVYFPDTYLIPKDENGKDIALRMINRFDEAMASLFSKFAAKDIKWTTGIKIASLIQREAAGSEDMPLISGIIWNRLEQGIKLQIDATMQYTKGKTTEGWWNSIDLKEKTVDSPYNTYLYKGLPPTPICNPGINAIKAVLNPTETNCIFYLHDASKQIHCAKTYEQHKINIEKYLK